MPPLKTTIGDKSLYDNIWIHPRYTREYKGQRDMVRFDREQYDGNLRNASREMSDHRPIWAAFGTGNDDDPDDYGDLSTAVVGARSSSLP